MCIRDSIKAAHPDCAVTLSVGEHSKETYQLWFDAGADRDVYKRQVTDIEHNCSAMPTAASVPMRFAAVKCPCRTPHRHSTGKNRANSRSAPDVHASPIQFAARKGAPP